MNHPKRMKTHLTFIALGLLGVAVTARAVTNPVVACTSKLYARSDCIGSGGNCGHAVKIHHAAAKHVERL